MNNSIKQLVKSKSNWDDTDLKDGLRFSQELEDQNSCLAIFIQDLLALREKTWQGIKRQSQDDSSLRRDVGKLEGIDMAIERPAQIVTAWREELEQRQNEKGAPNVGDNYANI